MVAPVGVNEPNGVATLGVQLPCAAVVLVVASIACAPPGALTQLPSPITGESVSVHAASLNVVTDVLAQVTPFGALQVQAEQPRVSVAPVK